MSKPRTKGETIGVRFNLTVDEEIRKRAAERQISPGVWVERQIDRAVIASMRESVAVNGMAEE